MFHRSGDFIRTSHISFEENHFSIFIYELKHTVGKKQGLGKRMKCYYLQILSLDWQLLILIAHTFPKENPAVIQRKLHKVLFTLPLSSLLEGNSQWYEDSASNNW